MNARFIESLLLWEADRQSASAATRWILARMRQERRSWNWPLSNRAHRALKRWCSRFALAGRRLASESATTPTWRP